MCYMTFFCYFLISTYIFKKIFKAASIAKQKAVQLNEKLNYLPSILTFGNDSEQQQQYFEEELEINDFPQQLRYKVCSRVQKFIKIIIF